MPTSGMCWVLDMSGCIQHHGWPGVLTQTECLLVMHCICSRQVCAAYQQGASCNIAALEMLVQVSRHCKAADSTQHVLRGA